MDHKKELKEKIRVDYEQRIKQWTTSDPAQLIAIAEEIVAARLVYDSLLNVISDEDAAFLLHLDDSLEVMSCRWISENGLDAVHDDELIHCVGSLQLDASDQGVWCLMTDDPNMSQDDPEMGMTTC